MATAMRTSYLCRRTSSFLFQKRCSSIVATNQEVDRDDQQTLYPPIKPKYPPGQWGSMEPDYAWLWHTRREKILAIQDPQKRTAALCVKPIKQVVYKVRDMYPRLLPYQKYVTKTHLVQGQPDIYNTSLNSEVLDSLAARLEPLVCDLIVMETEQIERRAYLATHRKTYHDMRLTHVLISNILQNLIAHMSEQYPHLHTAQYDEDVQISSFWDRHGFKRQRQLPHPKIKRSKLVHDLCFAADTKADFILRSTKPLPQFAELTEAPCIGPTVPHPGFRPIALGQSFKHKGRRAFQAGHNWGDPCEFGLMSVQFTHWSQYVADNFGPHHASDARLGQGIGASFVWLVAQAINQGFNTYIDLTYPLTTQTVLTDGKRWQFLAYQLNTLALWLEDEVNQLVNVCWAGDEKELYAAVEDGKVRGFNRDVLRQLIAFMALAPADRPHNLRPTLPSTSPNPVLVEEFIPERKEEVVVVEEEKYVM